MDLNTGVPTLIAYCEKIYPETFLELQPGYVPLDGLCLDVFFSGFFFLCFCFVFVFLFEGGLLGQIIYKEYLVFIFSVVWPVWPK